MLSFVSVRADGASIIVFGAGIVICCLFVLGFFSLSYAFEEERHENVLLSFLWQAKVGESQTPFPGE